MSFCKHRVMDMCKKDGCPCIFSPDCFESEEENPMTNADRIRAMSDEELARFLASVENRRSANGGGAQWCGMAHALKWLQKPAEEVAHD